jgi:hypothetical protein
VLPVVLRENVKGCPSSITKVFQFVLYVRVQAKIHEVFGLFKRNHKASTAETYYVSEHHSNETR